MWCRGTTNDQPSQLQKQPPVKVMKLLMAGNARSGKTAALQRYCLNSFTEPYLQTIGVDFRTKTVVVNGKNYKAQIWDMAGQERAGQLFGQHEDALDVTSDHRLLLVHARLGPARGAPAWMSRTDKTPCTPVYKGMT